jgi:hypothetical protein
LLYTAAAAAANSEKTLRVRPCVPMFTQVAHEMGHVLARHSAERDVYGLVSRAALVLAVAAGLDAFSLGLLASGTEMGMGELSLQDRNEGCNCLAECCRL